jgi:hypothetical protein
MKSAIAASDDRFAKAFARLLGIHCSVREFEKIGGSRTGIVMPIFSFRAAAAFSPLIRHVFDAIPAIQFP